MQNTFCLTQKHTLLQAATSQPTKQSLQESMFFSTQERNSIFFPTLRCFNFFATAQPKTDKHSDSLLQTLIGQCILTRRTEARTANSGFKKLTVQWLNEVLCFVLSSVLADSFVLRNRQLLKPAKR